MMEFKVNRFREAVMAVRETAVMPGMDQDEHGWRENGRCSLDARLGHALGRRKDTVMGGTEAWAEELGTPP